MTKGEFPFLPENAGNTDRRNSPSPLYSAELSNFTVSDAYQSFITDNKWSLTSISDYKYQIGEKIGILETGDNSNNNSFKSNDQINIADYVENLPNVSVKRKIARILSTDAADETLYDIENIEHYLLVGRRTSSQSILKCCENKLLSNLNCNNCEDYHALSQQYDLPDLQKAASVVVRNKNSNSKTESDLKPKVNALFSRTENTLFSPTYSDSCKRYKSYNALFTCGEDGSKRTVTTVVFDTEMRKKSYRDLKRGTKISKHFQCCCMQSDEDCPPKVFLSFGKSVFEYDPILNKCKERASLKCKRSKFCMVSHGNRCFVIGGVYKCRKVLEIEEYDTKHNSWKIVARLPGDSLPINASCVVFGDLVYIFSTVLTIDGEIKQNATAVLMFHPIKKTVKLFSEIPISFRQIKSCVHGPFIYLASDQKQLIRFSPVDGSYVLCADQNQECKDFGMFTLGDTIFLAGGINKDGTSTDIIRTFCTTSSSWCYHPEKLPEPMAICGTCEVKIPNSSGFIVPFYETNVFEKR